MKPLTYFVFLCILSLVVSGCKREPLPLPLEDEKLTHSSDAEKTISRFVIHSMDFKNYSSGDGTSGPDLYFKYRVASDWNTYEYTYVNIKYNVTPAMLPLTIINNNITKADFTNANLLLLDYDATPYTNQYSQDYMSYSLSESKEYFNGTEYYVNFSDEGSSCKVTVYYTYN